MKIYFALFFALFLGSLNAQYYPFNEESDVINYMEDKAFYNSDVDMVIEFGVIPSLNTIGIKVKNTHGQRFYFINVKITPYSKFADLYGMGVDDGSNFGFRLYKDRLVVGDDGSEQMTFILL
jgi:hypothetical protein